MSDSGRGSGGWKFALLLLLLAIEAPGSMVGAVC